MDWTALFQNGPLVGVIGVLLYFLVRERERHAAEMAAERALNAHLQEKRVEDQKVLIPLGHSMVAATEQSHAMMKKVLDK